MTVRWLSLLVVLSLLVLGGCGSGTSPVLIAGNYFPIPPVGTVWTYGVDYEAEIANVGEYTVSGTWTRTYEGTAVLVVDGAPTLTHVFRHDYAFVPPPPGSFLASPLGATIIGLFSAPGGLSSVRAYYRLVSATPARPDHVELVALERIPGPINIITGSRPYLLNPPYDGAAQDDSIWFMPQPLMPFVTEMSGFASNEKLLEYTAVAGVGGSANAVESIYFYSAMLPGPNLALDGRGRVLYKDGVGVFGSFSGFENTDFSATLTAGDDTGQVTSSSYLTAIGPVFPFP